VSIPGSPSQRSFLACWEDDTHTTLDAWVDSTQADDRKADLMLQMDIRGPRVPVLASVSAIALLSRSGFNHFIEFITFDHLWNQGFFYYVGPRSSSACLRSHYCVHLIPTTAAGSIVRGWFWRFRGSWNSPFLRKTAFPLPPSPLHRFPHPLDVDNTSKVPSSCPEWLVEADAI